MAVAPNNKISASNSLNKNALSNKDFFFGVKDGDDYGPTSATGFYNGVAIPLGGYVIYFNNSGTITADAPTNDTECLKILNIYGASAANISDALTWAASQSNIIVQGSPYVLNDLPGGATPTPTPSITPTNTPTISLTPTLTRTPTPTPTAGATGFLTISEVGSNVVMSVSGTIDLSGLTLVEAGGGPYGGGGFGPSTATYLIGTTGVSFDTYSGFTTNPTSFGSGGGSPVDSTTGDVFGVIYQGTPPYTLIVPSGYTSGTQITSSATFTGETFSSLGLTIGTYTYTWGSGKSMSVVIGNGIMPTPTPTPSTGGNVGVGSWYFYSDEGNLNAPAPTANGNAIFTIQGSPIVETFNPNKSGGVTYLYFSVKDSVGTDYTSQFSGYTGGTGTITLSQNGDTATYTSTTSGSFMIQNGGGGNNFFMIAVNPCTQTKTSNAPFVYTDPISIRFGS